MRDYGKVHTQFWASPSIKGLEDDAKMMALYLLTSQHGTIAGIFRLPDGYAMEDLGWAKGKVAAVMNTLREQGFAERCEETKWVWINKHLEWNPPENPNQWKAVNKLAASVPDGCKWKKGFERVLEGFRNGKNRVPKPVAVAVAGTVSWSREKGFAVPDEIRASWLTAYPAVSLDVELAKANAWLIANPKNIKSNYARFLNNWLRKAQDSAPRVKVEADPFKGMLHG
jgi:hypothetical protein